MNNNRSIKTQKQFLSIETTAAPTANLLTGKRFRPQSMLKKALIIFSICLFTGTSVMAQDEGYYTDDQSTVTIKSQEAPPPIPDYVQPPCPGDGYYWTPGYWSWTTGGYYWVAGIWVMPPSIGLLWTPAYWSFYNGFYGWHPGYWGPHIGYYGGINYGFGYFGTGFYGGRWDGGHFMYNTAVWRVGVNIHNTYVTKVNITNNTRVSFNGPGGVRYRPNNDEMGALRENHVAPGKDQLHHEETMRGEKGQFHNNNPKPVTHSMSAPGGQRFDERGRTVNMGGMRGGGGRHGR
ncbi:YXWGXW repeat-containing protein [Chitinophagaceae bacterium LWZ2-11]